jgi:putative ABC transport system permease protein
MRELQYALRRLRGSPGFTIAATLTLAIAIGATASVFGVVDGVLLKAFPYRDPDRVLTIWEGNAELHVPKFTVSPGDFLDFSAQNRAYTALAASVNSDAIVTGSHESEHLSGLAVTPSYFPVLGITPVLGRSLSPDSGGLPEVVIGYGYWQRQFGGAPSVIGQPLTLDDHPYTIVGVMPVGLPGTAELWTRLSIQGAELVNRETHYLHVYGRLKPGVTPEGGQLELETIARRLAQTFPKTNENWSVVTTPLLDQLVGEVRPALVMLLSAASCVLLIGAANLANLFLVRYLARQRELAVRTALGATRGRLVRELLIEAATLGVVAGTLGVGVAAAGVRILRALAPPALPRLSEIGIDGRLIAFCAFTSIATVLVFGVLPAWQASRNNLADVMKEGGRGTGSAQHHRLQDGLVVLQVTIALVLLTGAGLLVESFDHFRRMDPGFRPDGVLTAQVDLPPERYPTPARQAAFITSAVEQLAALPGVMAASASSDLPGLGGGSSKARLAIVGDPAPDPSHTPVAVPLIASPGYFSTMGIALLRGRGLLPTDDSRSVKVAVVDELLARRYFGARDPLGQHLAFVDESDTVVIVGIVAPVKQNGLDADDWPEIYLSLAQVPVGFADVEVRTSGDPEAQTAAVKHAIARLDRTVPVSDVQTMGERMTQSVGTTRFSSFLASLFAVVALLLGAVGIYSVLAYIVSQRQREIAVRIALGASQTQVMGDVVRRAFALTSVGIALGTGVAWVLTHALAGLFVGVSPHDPGIFVGAAAVFAVVALAAAAVPAFRTARVNPVVALTST